MQPGLFRSTTIWRRVSDERAVLYQCIERLDTHLFGVLVASSVKLPVDASIAGRLASTFVEQFIVMTDDEIGDDEKLKWFPNISDAVAAHDREFDGDYFRSIEGYVMAFGLR
jgi:hypothetical protein